MGRPCYPLGVVERLARDSQGDTHMAIEVSDAELEADIRAAAGSMEAGVLEAAGGPKEIFCKHWPMARTALEALGGMVGGFAKIAIMTVIKAGDIAHKNFCPAS